MKSKKNVVSEGRVTTPEFRLAFPHIFEPAANLQGKMKYSIVMLFPKGLWETELVNLRNLVNEVIKKQWGETPDNFLSPFKIGDDKEYDGYAGSIFASAASEYKRVIVDQGNKANGIKPSEIIDTSEVYAGCYARASLNAYAWDVMNKRGVSFGFLAAQKTRDGVPFSRFAHAENDFDPITPELADGVITPSTDTDAELL